MAAFDGHLQDLERATVSGKPNRKAKLPQVSCHLSAIVCLQSCCSWFVVPSKEMHMCTYGIVVTMMVQTTISGVVREMKGGLIRKMSMIAH